MIHHSLLQCAMYVQVVKLCLQPETSCGLARHQSQRKVTGAPKPESILSTAQCEADAFPRVGVEGSIIKKNTIALLQD